MKEIIPDRSNLYISNPKVLYITKEVIVSLNVEKNEDEEIILSKYN